MYSGESSGKLNKSRSSNKGLMFVDVKLNGKPLLTQGPPTTLLRGQKLKDLGYL
ncbi:hypothetical protein CsSME_00018622 [Camellia sinensis var. sinensis]